MFGSNSLIMSDGMIKGISMNDRNEIGRSEDIVTAEPEIKIYPLSNGLYCVCVVI